jgi:hypothetical protein
VAECLHSNHRDPCRCSATVCCPCGCYRMPACHCFLGRWFVSVKVSLLSVICHTPKTAAGGLKGAPPVAAAAAPVVPWTTAPPMPAMPGLTSTSVPFGVTEGQGWDCWQERLPTFEPCLSPQVPTCSPAPPLAICTRGPISHLRLHNRILVSSSAPCISAGPVSLCSRAWELGGRRCRLKVADAAPALGLPSVAAQPGLIHRRSQGQRAARWDRPRHDPPRAGPPGLWPPEHRRCNGHSVRQQVG